MTGGDASRRRKGVRASRPRRWPGRLAITLGAIVLVIGGVFAWAYASVGSSTMARAMVWFDADVDDQRRFPSRVIPRGDDVSPLPAGDEIDLDGFAGDLGGGEMLDRSLGANKTLAFLVVHRDRIVYERYFDGAERGTLQTSFSVAKSVLSTLIGLAIEEELIESVDDPVTRYIPELAERDRRFEEITLRDLMTMSSGMRYEEAAIPVPWGDDVTTYYGTDLRKAALADTEIVAPPATVWHYNNYNPLLLGMVLERVTGMSVSDYVSTALWQPLGAERDATWSLDSERTGFEKMESGFNAAPVDYARFGLLFLHRGEWNGTRIVSQGWVDDAVAGDTTGDPAPHYQYYWWIDTERPGRYYALGNLGQYIYVAPDADTVIVRSGREWGVENDRWLDLFRGIADRLASA